MLPGLKAILGKMSGRAPLGPISHVGGTSGNAINGGALTLTTPAGAQAGDLVIMVIGSSNSPVMTTTGFTPLYSDANRLLNYKYWNGAPDATIVIASPGGASDCHAAALLVLRNVDPTTPIDVTTTTITGSSGVPNPPSITVSVGGVVVAAMHSDIQDSSVTVPTGYNNMQNATCTDSNADIVVGIAWKTVAAGATEDPASFTGVTSATWRAWSAALRQG